jgi:hypothetical protein
VVVKMMNWNSPISRATDVIFGVLPALYFGFWAVIECYFSAISFMNQFIRDRVGLFLLFLLSLAGLRACLSLIYVSIARENVRSRKWNIVFLVFGIAVTVLMFIFPTPLNLMNGLKTVFPYFAISLVLIATKHIFMLSLPSEVQP